MVVHCKTYGFKTTFGVKVWYSGEEFSIDVMPLFMFHPNENLFPARISNHMLSKMWDEITYPFLTSTV